MLRTFQNMMHTDFKKGLSDHIELLKAICEENADAADRFMRVHIHGGRRSLQRSRLA